MLWRGYPENVEREMTLFDICFDRQLIKFAISQPLISTISIVSVGTLPRTPCIDHSVVRGTSRSSSYIPQNHLVAGM